MTNQSWSNRGRWAEATRKGALAQTLEGQPTETTEADVWQAWRVDHDPDEGDYHAAYEHGQWWVMGWDSDDERHTYSVVEVAGPTGPLGFEEV